MSLSQAPLVPQRLETQRASSPLSLFWSTAFAASRGSTAGVSSVPSTSPQWVAAFVDIAELVITLLPPSFLLLSPPLLSLPPSTTTHTEPEQVAVCVALCIVPQLPSRVRKGPGVLAAPTGW